MATDSLMKLIRDHAVDSSNFRPYMDHSHEADAITVRFKPDADYSVRLTDHVTVLRSLDTRQLVGCRIKGIADLLVDLPNFVTVDDGGVKLSFIFLSFRGGAEGEARETFKELAIAAGDMRLQPAGK
jgi:hypothetical protein